MAPRRGLQSLLRTCGRAAPLIDHSLPGPPWLESHVPNTCRNRLDARLIRSSDGLRLPVYKTAALPTELHRRVTRCLVAGLRPDARHAALVWGCGVAAVPPSPPLAGPCGDRGAGLRRVWSVPGGSLCQIRAKVWSRERPLTSMIHPDVDVGWPGRAGRLWVLFAGSGDNGGPAGGPGGRGFHGPWVVLL